MSSVFLHLSDLPSTLAWLRARAPQGQLRTDSRHVQPGDIFIAWPGAAVDGRAFVAQALAHGAAACLVEHDGSADFAFADARIASFTGLKAVTGSLAAQWLGHPAQALRIVAVTAASGSTKNSSKNARARPISRLRSQVASVVPAWARRRARVSVVGELMLAFLRGGAARLVKG